MIHHLGNPRIFMDGSPKFLGNPWIFKDFSPNSLGVWEVHSGIGIGK